MNTIAPAFEDAEKGSSLWHDAWLRLRKNKLALFGGSVLLFMIVVALLTPWIAPYSYEAQNLDLGASPPSAAHWLGTDIFGRDVLTQIMYGGRISLAVGFIATAEGIEIALVHDGGHPVQTQYFIQARVIGLNAALVITPDFGVAA